MRKIKHIIMPILFVGISFAGVAQIPEVQYTELEDYYYPGTEITCTARVYSNGLIDQLCAIYYSIYKDDFTNPISSVGNYGSVEYTVRSQGDNYITQSITNGSGYLSVKPLFTNYQAFTLGIFDNYCVSRNRPVAISMIFDVPGVYRFNADIQSCTNTGSSTWTSFTANGAPGCGTASHTDYAAGSCSNPTTLFSDFIVITICDQNSIAFVSGDTEYCPGEELNLVYSIGTDDDAVDLDLLPSWITANVNNSTNTLTLTGTIPPYDPENPTISFDVRSICTYNPETCPGAVINQSITILNAQSPAITGSNFLCNGNILNLNSDIAGTWYSSNPEIIDIEQTEPDNEVVITALSAGTSVISCENTANVCQAISEDFLFTVNPNSETFLTEAICEGDVYIFGGNELTTEGEYLYTTTTELGCDSVIHLNLSVYPKYEFSEDASICKGETYTWRGNDYTIGGIYYDSLQTVNSCDSVFVLNLTTFPSYEFIEDVSICQEDTYTWRGNDYALGGIYYDSLLTVNSCDSVFVLNLTVNEIFSESVNANICAGESYVLGSQTLSEAGEYTETFESINGCDSVVTLNLNILTIAESEFIATGQTYTWNEITYTENGDYTQTFTGANGCDSIVTLHFTFTTDIVSQNIKDNISVYPNPASSVIYIDINSPEVQNLSVNITDISGKIVVKQGKLSSYNSLNIEKLSDGTYFINVFLDNKFLVTKMINKSR